jgi:hypothetical protein
MKKICFIFILIFISINIFAQDNELINNYLRNQVLFYRNKDNSIIYNAIELFNTLENIPENSLNPIKYFYFGIKINDIEIYYEMYNIARIHNNIQLLGIFNFIEQYDVIKYSNYWDNYNYYDERFTLFYSASGNQKYIIKIMRIIQESYYDRNDINKFISAREALYTLSLLIRINSGIQNIYNNSYIVDDKIKHYINSKTPNEIKFDTNEILKYWE